MVYFFGTACKRYVKIGFTADVKTRRKSVNAIASGRWGRVAVPVFVCLEMPGDRYAESATFARFAADRIGREWFNFSTAVKDYILANGGRLNDPSSKNEEPIITNRTKRRRSRIVRKVLRDKEHLCAVI